MGFHEMPFTLRAVLPAHISKKQDLSAALRLRLKQRLKPGLKLRLKPGLKLRLKPGLKLRLKLRF